MPKWCQNTAEHAKFRRAMHLRGPKNNYLPGMRNAAKGAACFAMTCAELKLIQNSGRFAVSFCDYGIVPL